jgi:DNA-binding transcriptional MerR regulator
MTEPIYSAGVAEGMTSVPKSTIRRYVRELGKYFSPGAQIERGRKFTLKDIELIRLIRGMTNDRFDIPAITEVLDKGWDPSQLSQKAISDAAPIMAKVEVLANELREEITKLRQVHHEIEEGMIGIVKAHNILISNRNGDREDINFLVEYINWMNLPFYKKWFTDPPNQPEHKTKVVVNDQGED